MFALFVKLNQTDNLMLADYGVNHACRSRSRDWTPEVVHDERFTARRSADLFITIGVATPDFFRLISVYPGCPTTVSGGHIFAAEPQTRPNAIVFFAEDLGRNESGPCGNESVRTPTLDRIAAEGLRRSASGIWAMKSPNKSTTVPRPFVEQRTS